LSVFFEVFCYHSHKKLACKICYNIHPIYYLLYLCTFISICFLLMITNYHKQWHKTSEMYYLTFLEVRSINGLFGPKQSIKRGCIHSVCVMGKLISLSFLASRRYLHSIDDGIPLFHL
jgi:hypothetical protein